MRPYREITQLLVYLFCLFILAYAALIVPSSPKKGAIDIIRTII